MNKQSVSALVAFRRISKGHHQGNLGAELS